MNPTIDPADRAGIPVPPGRDACPGLTASHRVDSLGNPAGGHTYGPGYHVNWRDTTRPSDSGACVADLICAALDRLLYLQTTPAANSASAEAIRHLGAALKALEGR